MTTECLVFHGIWHIARPSVFNVKGMHGPDGDKVEDDVYRLAWCTREGAFICFDFNEPEVKPLPQ